MPDTVFVFGAGFSAPADMPIARNLMREVLRRPDEKAVRATYRSLFGHSHDGVEEMADIPMEDVFTVLDRAIRGREAIRGFAREQIESARAELVRGILALFAERLAAFDERPYRAFFEEVVARRLGDGSPAAQSADPFSIISLNWDTIPDWLVDRYGTQRGVAVDYACYDDAAPGSPHHVPSLMLKAKGCFNVKLLKLHGSVNWLLCPSCSRLYSIRGGDEGPPRLDAEERVECAHCEGVETEALIVTPTLLKDLRPVHLASVWHQAMVDLQEARRIVFVGYSFPTSDFELRYVLLKALTGRQRPAVRVVLYPPDEKCDPRRKVLRELKEERYRSFFGRDVEFAFVDAETFLERADLAWEW